MFELLLISVVLSSGYLGFILLRRYGPQQRVYGMMVVADFVLALLAFASRSSDGPNSSANTMGAIAIGAAFCLTILPAMLRDVGRRMMARQYLRPAKFLADFRELLQPGMGARQESELIQTIVAVRDGREDEIIKAMEERKSRSEEPAFRSAMDERIIMILLFAQRWHDAVHRYERAVSMGRRPGSPQLTVAMVRACCEDDELDSAADLVRLVRDSPLAEEPALRTLFARGNLVFLAFMGRTGAVESMMARGGELFHMQEATRSYWMGISRMYAGDIVGARSSLQDAVERTKGEPALAKSAQRQLDRLSGDAVIRPTQASAETCELADQLTAAVSTLASTTSPEQDEEEPSRRKLPSMSGIPIREMPVTFGFAAANIAASIAVYFLYGGITDLGALILSGANLKSATLMGEWWRIGSSMFLHAGIAHLVLNVYGLWVLGRLVEQLYGSSRTAAIYVLSGVVAGLASTLLGGTTTAVGASGAVLGLMGAALVELGVYRKNYPAHFARPLVRLLLLISVAQIAIGFFYPIVDQWGHVGGLVGGLGLGVVLSHHAKIGKTLRTLSATLFVVCSAAFVAYSVYGVARSDYSETLRAYPSVHHEEQGLAVELPSSWKRVGVHEYMDWGVSAQLDLRVLPESEGLDAVISKRLAMEKKEGGLQAGFDIAKASAQGDMELPEPWRSGELEVRIDDESGVQHYRLLVFGRVVGDEIWLGSYYYPAALTDAIEPVFAQILSSIR